MRQNLLDKRLALIVSVSDVFNTLRERIRGETPELRQRIERRRSARICNIGLIWNFGKMPKKQKDDMQFDTAL